MGFFFSRVVGVAWVGGSAGRGRLYSDVQEAFRQAHEHAGIE